MRQTIIAHKERGLVKAHKAENGAQTLQIL